MSRYVGMRETTMTPAIASRTTKRQAMASVVAKADRAAGLERDMVGWLLILQCRVELTWSSADEHHLFEATVECDSR